MLPGNWPTFWQGTTKGWAGMVRVDGQAYVFMGQPSGLTGLIQIAVQKATYITPTQTIFTIAAGPIELTVTFMSPVEYDSIELQSIPLSYVLISAKSTDGSNHKVELYMDISAEWASSDDGQTAKWSLNTENDLKTWTVELVNPLKFSEHADYAQWGQAVITTTGGASHKSGTHTEVRRSFVTSGTLDNTTDTDFRCIECNWPLVALSHDLGQVGAQEKSVQFTVGQVREENINLRGVAQKALWTYYFDGLHDMIRFFFNDVQIAMERSDKLDEKLLTEAHTIGGQE